MSSSTFLLKAQLLALILSKQDRDILVKELAKDPLTEDQKIEIQNKAAQKLTLPIDKFFGELYHMINEVPFGNQRSNSDGTAEFSSMNKADRELVLNIAKAIKATGNAITSETLGMINVSLNDLQSPRTQNAGTAAPPKKTSPDKSGIDSFYSKAIILGGSNKDNTESGSSSEGTMKTAVAHASASENAISTISQLYAMKAGGTGSVKHEIHNELMNNTEIGAIIKATINTNITIHDRAWALGKEIHKKIGLMTDANISSPMTVEAAIRYLMSDFLNAESASWLYKVCMAVHGSGSQHTPVYDPSGVVIGTNELFSTIGRILDLENNFGESVSSEVLKHLIPGGTILNAIQAILIEQGMKSKLTYAFWNTDLFESNPHMAKFLIQPNYTVAIRSDKSYLDGAIAWYGYAGDAGEPFDVRSWTEKVKRKQVLISKKIKDTYLLSSTGIATLMKAIFEFHQRNIVNKTDAMSARNELYARSVERNNNI